MGLPGDIFPLPFAEGVLPLAAEPTGVRERLRLELPASRGGGATTGGSIGRVALASFARSAVWAAMLAKLWSSPFPLPLSLTFVKGITGLRERLRLDGAASSSWLRRPGDLLARRSSSRL